VQREGERSKLIVMVSSYMICTSAWTNSARVGIPVCTQLCLRPTTVTATTVLQWLCSYISGGGNSPAAAGGGNAADRLQSAQHCSGGQGPTRSRPDIDA